MKTTIVALSAAALLVAAPAVLAQNVSSKTPDQHHKVFKKHPKVVSGYAPWHASVKMGYPEAFGYAPSAPKDYTYEQSRMGGGGGGDAGAGGGGGGGM